MEYLYKLLIVYNQGEVMALKFLTVIAMLFSLLNAKESCILVFSTKIVYTKDKKTFLKRFPSGVIEKYNRYYEFKLDSFRTYKDALKKLQTVRKYYKDAFIINCVKRNKEILIKSPVIKMVKKSTKSSNSDDSIKTVVFLKQVKEIKAATYNQMVIECKDGKWKCQMVLDS